MFVKKKLELGFGEQGDRNRRGRGHCGLLGCLLDFRGADSVSCESYAVPLRKMQSWDRMLSRLLRSSAGRNKAYRLSGINQLRHSSGESRTGHTGLGQARCPPKNISNDHFLEESESKDCPREEVGENHSSPYCDLHCAAEPY